MDIKAIYVFLQADLARVETLIGTALGSDIGLLDQTNRQLREHPGKMMRPVLALLAAGAVGTVNESTFHYAAATELLHNATLLHDDVVDGATERRGMPTVYKLIDAPAAVLIGDFWLVRCLKLVLSAQVEPQRVLTLFSDTLGHLAEGELLQMEKAAHADTTEEDYLRIIYGKTASLFVSTVTSAAISVKATQEQVEALGNFARLLGIAFQIKDDILDYQEPSAALGKPVGIDLREQKITQPLLCALKTVSPEEEALIRRKVADIAGHPELEEEVRNFVIGREGPARAEAVLEGYIEKALRCLDGFPDTPQKACLKELTHFVAGRNA